MHYCRVQLLVLPCAPLPRALFLPRGDFPGTHPDCAILQALINIDCAAPELKIVNNMETFEMQRRGMALEMMLSERDQQPTVMQTQFHEFQGEEVAASCSGDDECWGESWVVVEYPRVASAEGAGSRVLVQLSQEAIIASSTEETAALADFLARHAVAEPENYGRLRRLLRSLQQYRLFGRNETEGQCITISKELLKRKPCNSHAFYTSGGNRGYLMQMKFDYCSTTAHQNDVRVCVYMQRGKNDRDLYWPLKATVLIVSDESRGRPTYPLHRSSITGTWEKPGTQCMGELSAPYEKLQADRDGMLHFIVQVLPE